ncbi:ATP-binding protein [Streptomyces sp. H27-S2]|uniref:ATP-binding protein n=1 Tax=Streptomyces antarcticus TaxID=2996458 RepID=UPI00226D717E|nr:ATP-binding protein [Streptomyces sp. H27-S2]MCY0949657.1 ATP-binding protein [Streptomyces sp. H27-S2]
MKGSPYEGAATTKPVRTKQDVRAAVLGVSAGGVLVIMAVGLGAGWVVSRRLLAPLYEVAGAAAKARDGGLAYRITAAFCRARSRVGTGHGLGLALVRSIAVAHRGSASAAANPEGGLTVRASFPAP